MQLLFVSVVAKVMNLADEQRRVRRSSLLATLFCAAVLVAAWYVLPLVMTFPEDVTGALVLALRADLFVALWVIVAVRLVSRGRYRSAADISGSAAGPPSPALAIKAAFLQNTLEQAFLAIAIHLALASVLRGPALSLIVGAVILFSIGRLAFYVRYGGGAGARAFGMVTTMLPSVLGFLLAVVLLVLPAPRSGSYVCM